MKMVSSYYHSVVHTEPKQGHFSFMKTRNEELCQNRCRLSCASLLCAAVKLSECNLCNFYPKPLAGIQALSCLIHVFLWLASLVNGKPSFVYCCFKQGQYISS